MIEIIKEPVVMPPFSQRPFKKESNFNCSKWWVVDTRDNSIRYKGSYENVVLACHNLNKAFYKEQQQQE